jgi:prolyl-tRNA synthetase
MRFSSLYATTKRENPKDAEIISHQLMLRTGMIKKLSSGLYTWLPLGLKVLQKISNIIREEMSSIGFCEILMPAIQPSRLWVESGRWEKYGPLLLKIKDRHDKEYCFGPTHEEIVADLIRQDLSTYKELPIKVYQIQTKFRDEIRPRYGVMRGREFMMKDGYSFNTDEKSLDDTYNSIMQAYYKIFKRMGLNVKAVQADTGNMRGDTSHEFHVIADAGEDLICFSDQSDYASNIELCPAIQKLNNINNEEIQEIKSINYKGDLTNTKKFPKNIDQTKLVKSIIVKGIEEKLVMLVMHNKHTLNITKVEKHPLINTPLEIVSNDQIKNDYNHEDHYLGPVNSKLPIIIDSSIKNLKNSICGANEQGAYYINVNWSRDLDKPEYFDLRNVTAGELSPDGNGNLQIKKGIEVGHIFKLKDTYTKPLKVQYTDANGKISIPYMGCYGIGVGRLVAATIEQHHDQKGITWPLAIAPFEVIIIPINFHKNEDIKNSPNNFIMNLNKNLMYY